MKLGKLRQLTSRLSALDITTINPQEYLLQLGLDPNKLYQELEMTSRFVDTHRDSSFSNAHMQLHSHVFYELLYCRNNCGVEYLVGSERYRLQKGDIVFVPPGISHRPLLPEVMESPYERYVIWLSQEFIDMYARSFPYTFSQMHNHVGLLRTDGTPWESLGELFRAGVLEAERQEDGWEAAVLGNTITLLTQIKRATNQRTLRSMKAEAPVLLDQLAAYVEKNYASKLTLGALSKRYFVSPSTISHLFQQKLGVSFDRYVTQRRLIAAKTLIEKGVLLEDVAVQTGFGDYTGFFRAFKQEYGISPRQYRQLQGADN